MARNGSGVYSLPAGSVVVNGDTSDATDVNTPIADIAADLNVARPIVAGGTGATSASAARTALGLAIGTNVQAYDAALTSVAALGTAANKGIYFTGVDTAAEFDLTVQGRQLLDDGSFADMRTTLGLGSTATRDIDNTEDLDTNATDVLTRGGVKTAIENYATDKIFASLHLSDSGVTINDSVGVASVSRLSTGRYQVFFSDDQPDLFYRVMGTAEGVTSQGFCGVVAVDTTAATPKAVGSCIVGVYGLGVGSPYASQEVSMIFTR